MYYIILDPHTNDVSIQKDMDGNIEDCTTWEEANNIGSLAKDTGACKHYIVVTECTE
jgi:hypothetical protein